jgi:hypothetical protein
MIGIANFLQKSPLLNFNKNSLIKPWSRERIPVFQFR